MISKSSGNNINYKIWAMIAHRLMLRAWTSHWIAPWFRKSPSTKYFQRFRNNDRVVIILRWRRNNSVYYQYYLHTLLALGIIEPWYTMHWEMHSPKLPWRVYILTRLVRKQGRHIPPMTIILYIGDWEKLQKHYEIPTELCERSVDWASSDEVPVQHFNLYFTEPQLSYNLGS